MHPLWAPPCPHRTAAAPTTDAATASSSAAGGGRAAAVAPAHLPSGGRAARRHTSPLSPRATLCRCLTCPGPRTAGSEAAVSVASTPAWRSRSATKPTALQFRVADPRDAAALAALDAACAVDGSSGWSEGIYQADLRPGGPNLILLCELAPPPLAAAATSSAAVEALSAAEAAVPEAQGIVREPLVVALAAGCEVAGEVSLTNLAVVGDMRGTGLGGRMACELLARLGAERHPTFLEVRKDNAAAQALYGKLGFGAVGVRKGYNSDGSDSLVMIRQPAPLPWPSPPL